nr:phosphate ABC transporter substrate-binding protein PstS [Pseudomonas sp.]
DASWPVTSATFVLVHKTADNPEKTKAVFDFFNWAFEKGDDSAKALDYVALPDAVTDTIAEQWGTEVKDTSGQAVWK